MRMTGVAVPLTAYTIPPSAPEPVAEAWRELTRIGILYEDASDDLKGAQQALVAAQAADVKAIVEATNAGQEPDDPQANDGNFARVATTPADTKGEMVSESPTRLMSTNEVAAYLGVSRRSVLRLVGAGDLTPIRKG